MTIYTEKITEGCHSCIHCIRQKFPDRYPEEYICRMTGKIVTKYRKEQKKPETCRPSRQST